VLGSEGLFKVLLRGCFFGGCAFGGCLLEDAFEGYFLKDVSLRDVPGGYFGRILLYGMFFRGLFLEDVLEDTPLEDAFGGWETKWF
jgi:hypothetical protein